MFYAFMQFQGYRLLYRRKFHKFILVWNFLYRWEILFYVAKHVPMYTKCHYQKNKDLREVLVTSGILEIIIRTGNSWSLTIALRSLNKISFRNDYIVLCLLWRYHYFIINTPAHDSLHGTPLYNSGRLRSRVSYKRFTMNASYKSQCFHIYNEDHREKIVIIKL